MGFEFSWEAPARLIGLAALAVGAVVFAFSAFAAAHRRKAPAAFLAALAFAALPLFQARVALAKRLFPDASGVVEERVGLHMLAYGDCAGFVAKTGKGVDDGAVCRVRVRSNVGRWIGPGEPPAGSCLMTAEAELREWAFTRGFLRDACERSP